ARVSDRHQQHRAKRGAEDHRHPSIWVAAKITRPPLRAASSSGIRGSRATAAALGLALDGLGLAVDLKSNPAWVSVPAARLAQLDATILAPCSDNRLVRDRACAARRSHSSALAWKCSILDAI